MSLAGEDTAGRERSELSEVEGEYVIPRGVTEAEFLWLDAFLRMYFLCTAVIKDQSNINNLCLIIIIIIIIIYFLINFNNINDNIFSDKLMNILYSDGFDITILTV